MVDCDWCVTGSLFGEVLHRLCTERVCQSCNKMPERGRELFTRLGPFSSKCESSERGFSFKLQGLN
jgi:hypothetical protein